MNTPNLLALIEPINWGYFAMFNTDFEYLIEEYMVYCKSRQLRENSSSKKALKLIKCHILTIFIQNRKSFHLQMYTPRL